jgi:hypothetical protein
MNWGRYMILFSSILMSQILHIKINSYFCREIAGIAQLVEHDLAKVGVAGSSPVSRSDKKAVKTAFCLKVTSEGSAPAEPGQSRFPLKKTRFFGIFN